MYIPGFSSVFAFDPMAPQTLSLDKSHFTLDISGVAGFFGGDEAVSAMGTVHIYGGRHWLGWYNSPGSYQIARRYDLLAKSRLFEGLFPGMHTDPATLFGSDGWKGPKFRATHSGTIIKETGHLAALFVKECTALKGQDIVGRNSRAIDVTIAKLDYSPAPEMQPKHVNVYTSPFASIPIFASFTTCLACCASKDWYSFLSILLGIIASGVSCFVIGSANFVFVHPEPAKGSPPGDGLLISDTQVVVLKGAEGAVNSITCGRFSLRFSSETKYRSIGWCSVLFAIQFIAQLLLVPQGSLFGQIMFVTSLVVSWIYNWGLSSLDKEKIQRDILLNNVLQKPTLTKYNFSTRTAMAAFVLLILQLDEPEEILKELLPNDTKVWRAWKGTILYRLRFKEKFEFNEADWELRGFTQEEKDLLQTLFRDAQAAYRGYLELVVSRPPSVGYCEWSQKMTMSTSTTRTTGWSTIA